MGFGPIGVQVPPTDGPNGWIAALRGTAARGITPAERWMMSGRRPAWRFTPGKCDEGFGVATRGDVGVDANAPAGQPLRASKKAMTINGDRRNVGCPTL